MLLRKYNHYKLTFQKLLATKCLAYLRRYFEKFNFQDPFTKKPILYLENYFFREDPKPRPVSNVSLGDVFSWYFGSEVPLPSDPNVNAIAKRCREDSTYSGDRPKRVTWSSERETGHMLYVIARLLKPKAAIEVGIYNGAASICIAQALHDNGTNAPLHCVEIDHYNIELARKNVTEAGLAANVVFHEGSSSDERILEIIPDAEFIFIDGDHSYDGAKRDFENFRKKLKKGGNMVFHDTTKIIELRQLMEEISRMSGFSVFTIATTDGDGVTLIRKESD